MDYESFHDPCEDWSQWSDWDWSEVGTVFRRRYLSYRGDDSLFPLRRDRRRNSINSAEHTVHRCWSTGRRGMLTEREKVRYKLTNGSEKLTLIQRQRPVVTWAHHLDNVLNWCAVVVFASTNSKRWRDMGIETRTSDHVWPVNGW